MLCTCKARTEDDCVCTRLCECGERFEIVQRSDRCCDYCEKVEANDDVFDVYSGNRVIAKATLLDVVRFAHETNQNLVPFDEHVIDVGDLQFHRQHPDSFARHAEWFRGTVSRPYRPGITLEMIGLRNENGHLYLNF